MTTTKLTRDKLHHSTMNMRQSMIIVSTLTLLIKSLTSGGGCLMCGATSSQFENRYDHEDIQLATQLNVKPQRLVPLSGSNQQNFSLINNSNNNNKEPQVAVAHTRQHHHDHQSTVVISSLNSEIIDSTQASASQLSPAAPTHPNDNQESGQLHLGARIALTFLVATILLVAGATLADCSRNAQSDEKSYLDPEIISSPFSYHCHCQAQFGEYTQLGGQACQCQPANFIQRTHSLSSSCSSSLFCSSANSVASASVPILGTQSCGDADWRSKSASPIESIASAASIDELDLRSSTLKSTRSSAKAATQTAAAAATRTSTSTANRWSLNSSLLFELFLSFSLRQSAALIFQDSPSTQTKPSNGRAQLQSSSSEQSRRSKQSRYRSRILLVNGLNKSHFIQSNIPYCGHRSRLSSLSSINEQQQQQEAQTCSHSTFDDIHEDMKGNSSDPEEANHHHYGIGSSNNNATSKSYQNSKPQSIDSLHGLRFLSMIWVIVIHSYNFALRWLFFTNPSTLDTLYKTTASQLLANGSFACDSFFFAGGFLLPYLAFPNYQYNSSASSSSSNSNDSKSSPSTNSTTATSSPINSNNNQTLARFSLTPNCKQQFGEFSSSLHTDNCSGSPQLSQGQLSSPLNELNHHNHNHQQQVLVCPNNSTNIYLAPHGHVLNMNANQQQQQQQQMKHRQNIDSTTTGCKRQHSSFTNHKSNNTNHHRHRNLQGEEFTINSVLGNILHRYIRMMPLMMAIIGLSATLLRYLGEGPAWDGSTMMYDKWCRKNWWINALFLHNFVNRENMCLSHSWYSAVDIQLFLMGQLLLFVLFRNRRWGMILCCVFLFGSQLITGFLTLAHHLPAVPLISSVDEQTMNLYYGEIYIKPYCRASPYLIGILQAYLMRTTSLGQLRLRRWQLAVGWTLSIGTYLAILFSMQPAMNGQAPSELQSALYSALSRPLWACATGWMIFACMTKQGGPIQYILSAKCFAPLSRLTYPAFLIHPIVMAVFYGSRQSSFHFSHYLMLYLILGNIVITYASAFILSALFELPLLSAERVLKRAWRQKANSSSSDGSQ